MSRVLLVVFTLFLLTKPLYAAQSTITESEGSACMGDDRSKKQTEQAAIADAKKRAVEFASTYIKSETEVKNFVLEKDLLSAYTNAEVKIIQELEKAWYKDASSGDCYKVKIKAEVVPDTKALEKMAAASPAAVDDPAAPLKVKAWMDKKDYKQGEKVKVYIKGNKPFYARVLYKDASGETLQLLPNPFRTDNYFNGGVIYEVPTGNDKFELEVSPPFGEEKVSVYASTSPLGEIGTATRGAVFQVTTAAKDVGVRTRGIKISATSGDKAGSPAAAAEFFEDSMKVTTGK